MPRLLPAATVPALLLAAAIALRLVGLGYGLPAVYNPDEVAIMSRALSFGKGTLNPENFLYPTFYFYVLFAWVGSYLGALWASGGVQSVAELQQLYFRDPTGIFLAGRGLSVVAGAATVLLVQSLGRRLTDARTATAAALFLAVAPLHVRDSHYVKHDVFATMLVVAACLAVSRVWPGGPERERRTRDVVVAGAACGVAFSTHYYCIFLALPLSWAVVLAWKGQGWQAVLRQLAIAAAASAATFFLLSPFIALEPLTAWRDITANREIVIDRALADGALRPAVRYLEMLWQDSISAPIVALGAVGAVWMLRTDWRRAVLLLAFPLSFFAFITNTFPASRYLNPVLPFVALFAALALSRTASLLGARAWSFWGAVALFAMVPAAESLRADLFLRQTDTRSLALTYVEQHIPAGATVLIQPYSVPLTPSRQGLVDALTQNLGSVDAASAKFQLQLGLDPYPAPSYRLVFLGRGGLDADKIYVDPAELAGPDALGTLNRRGVAFVILKRYNGPDSALMPFLAALSRSGTRVAVFTPYRSGVPADRQAQIEPFLHNTDARIDGALERPGPTVEIWQLNGSGP